MLPHTNIGVLDRDDLARLREVTASQGLMLESVSERLMETVHAGSPTKHPAQRLATIEAAGELKIPSPAASWSASARPRRSRSNLSKLSPSCTRSYGHLQEVILQNFVPHPRYYGQEVAEIADEAARERWGDDGDPSAGASASVEAAVEVGCSASPVRGPSPCRLGRARSRRGHQAPDPGVQAADAGRRGAGAAESVGCLGGAGRGGGDGSRRAVGEWGPHLA